MRIAFTSCFSAVSFTKQPVWDQIGAVSPPPEHLLLLGDSVYYDGDGSNMGRVKEMGADAFYRHATERLRAQLNQTQFAKLVRRADLRIHPIWDDHDFLWNGACGAQIANQTSLKHLLPPTRAAFQAYRDALDSHDPATFPKPAAPWSPTIKEPGYRMIDIGDKTNPIRLHLTDGRSYKTAHGADVLGPAQMKEMASTILDSSANTVNIIASGLVFEAHHGETWMSSKTEREKMLELAATRRILILSGDVHENRFAVPYPAGKWNMFEATASGAALRTGIDIGELQCNWGLVDITPQTVTIKLSQLHMAPRTQVIDRASWKLNQPQ